MSEDLSILGLEGKVALVTGGGAGIGRATAELFARAGMKVVVAEIDAARVADTRAALDKAGAEHPVLAADVRKAGDVERTIAELGHRFGRLAVLVNHAGYFLGYRSIFEHSTAH